jgi:hypothetical protein
VVPLSDAQSTSTAEVGSGQRRRQSSVVSSSGSTSSSSSGSVVVVGETGKMKKKVVFDEAVRTGVFVDDDDTVGGLPVVVEEFSKLSVEPKPRKASVSSKFREMRMAFGQLSQKKAALGAVVLGTAASV